MELIHGGDWAGYETKYGTRPLDFSANTSPLGLPDGVRKAVEESLDDAAAYPDPLCRELRKALGRYHGVSPEWILCGNGAADLIYRLCFAIKAKKALIPSPSFAEYASAAWAAGTEVIQYYLKDENDFRPEEDFPDAITPETGLVFLCEPSNPAGVLSGREFLLKVLEKCRECGAILALDECFNEFLEQPEEHSLLSELAGGNLIIFRAFTKFYGMAGLRLGYCMSADTDLLEQMQETGAPWNVSVPAQAAGIAALKEEEYAARLRALIREQRAFLLDALKGMDLRVVPGEANFLLFCSPVPNLAEKMRRRGILVRSCDNYSGMPEDWVRVAVRTKEENERLLAALKEELENG